MCSLFVRQFRFPQYKPGCVRKMSKRKSISTHDKSTKRARPVEEEEDSEDADDRDQDVERLSPQVVVIDMLQNPMFLSEKNPSSTCSILVHQL